jgi:hypothetical protein
MTIFVLEEQNQILLFASEKEAISSRNAAEKEYQKMGWTHYYGEVRKFNKEKDFGMDKPFEFGIGQEKCKRIARRIYSWWNNYWNDRNLDD